MKKIIAIAVACVLCLTLGAWTVSSAIEALDKENMPEEMSDVLSEIEGAEGMVNDGIEIAGAEGTSDDFGSQLDQIATELDKLENGSLTTEDMSPLEKTP